MNETMQIDPALYDFGSSAKRIKTQHSRAGNNMYNTMPDRYAFGGERYGPSHINGSVNGPVSGLVNGSVNGFVNGTMNRPVNGLPNGPLGGPYNGNVNGVINRATTTSDARQGPVYGHTHLKGFANGHLPHPSPSLLSSLPHQISTGNPVTQLGHQSDFHRLSHPPSHQAAIAQSQTPPHPHSFLPRPAAVPEPTTQLPLTPSQVRSSESLRPPLNSTGLVWWLADQARQGAANAELGIMDPNGLSSPNTPLSSLPAISYHEADAGAEKERLRQENRVRKQRWRQDNQERNKDNDLRCRVNKLAKQKFGNEDTNEKLDFIEHEFTVRRAKREQKQRNRAQQSGTIPTFSSHSGLSTDLQGEPNVAVVAAQERARKILRLLGNHTRDDALPLAVLEESQKLVNDIGRNVVRPEHLLDAVRYLPNQDVGTFSANTSPVEGRASDDHDSISSEEDSAPLNIPSSVTPGIADHEEQPRPIFSALPQPSYLPPPAQLADFRPPETSYASPYSKPDPVHASPEARAPGADPPPPPAQISAQAPAQILGQDLAQSLVSGPAPEPAHVPAQPSASPQVPVPTPAVAPTPAPVLTPDPTITPAPAPTFGHPQEAVPLAIEEQISISDRQPSKSREPSPSTHLATKSKIDAILQLATGSISDDDDDDDEEEDEDEADDEAMNVDIPAPKTTGKKRALSPGSEIPTSSRPRLHLRYDAGRDRAKSQDSRGTRDVQEIAVNTIVPVGKSQVPFKERVVLSFHAKDFKLIHDSHNSSKVKGDSARDGLSGPRKLELQANGPQATVTDQRKIRMYGFPPLPSTGKDNLEDD